MGKEASFYPMPFRLAFGYPLGGWYWHRLNLGDEVKRLVAFLQRIDEVRAAFGATHLSFPPIAVLCTHVAIIENKQRQNSLQQYRVPTPSYQQLTRTNSVYMFSPPSQGEPSGAIP
eukprot:COSAG01_NODE_14150_length_1490_cov_6936.920201_1_plen_116_part_00